jgi:hypothetical protein
VHPHDLAQLVLITRAAVALQAAADTLLILSPLYVTLAVAFVPTRLVRQLALLPRMGYDRVVRFGLPR